MITVIPMKNHAKIGSHHEIKEEVSGARAKLANSVETGPFYIIVGVRTSDYHEKMASTECLEPPFSSVTSTLIIL